RDWSRKVDAKQSAAVRLGHPSRLRDTAHEKSAFDVECQADRTEKALAPERKTRALVLAVHALEVGQDNDTAEHQLCRERLDLERQLRQEVLSRERPKLSTGVVVGHTVDRMRPIVGHPDRWPPGRLVGVLPLGWVGKSIESPVIQVTELVRRDPFPLVIRKEH